MLKTKKYRGWWRGCLAAFILPLCLSVSVPLTAAAVPSVASSADRQDLLSSREFSPFSWLEALAGASPAYAQGGDGSESTPDAGDTFQDGTDATAPQESRGGSFTESLFFGSPFRGVGLVDILILAGLGLIAMRIFTARRGQEKKDRFTVRSGTSTPGNRRSDSLSGDARGKTPGKWPERNTSASEKSGGPAGRSSPPPQRDGEESAGRPENEAPSRRGRPMTVKENAAAHWGRYTGESDGAQTPEEAVEEGVRLPGGFDAGEFLEGARVLYVRLQKAWAARELENLSAFVTEDMMRQLRAQAASNPQPEDVDIILVNALLTDFTRQGREEKATVRFNVVMRSGDAGQSGEIEEQWRVTRGTEPDGMWRLAGIDPTAG